MNICAIISEFNPFTNGHQYIINHVKEKYGLDCLCLTSGNFVQRGEMAILDKYTRATCAVNAGADVVIELPLAFSLSSAEYFAYGSVKILQDIGVSHIAFGVKIDKPAILEKFAKIKANEPTKIKSLIKTHTKAGCDYNKSLKLAYESTYPEYKNELNQIFSEPNNILAVEYLSAIYKLNADIKPIFIQRLDGGYNIKKPTKKNHLHFISASALRNFVISGKNKKTKKYTPNYSFEYIKNINKLDLNSAIAKLDTLVISKLREYNYQQLAQINDVNTSISHILLDYCKIYNSTKEIVNACNSKNLKESRIKRTILMAYFDITKDTFNTMLNNALPVNVLAVSKSKKDLLSKLIKSSKIKLIVSLKDKNSLSENEKTIINIAQKANNLYNICNNKEYSEDMATFV